jgi:DNA-binding MarR family transcriptional regulator
MFIPNSVNNLLKLYRYQHVKYHDGPIYQSDILKHVSVESNKLAYHLNILRAAGLIDREYGRDGRNVSRYSIKEDGTKFLENIGAMDKLGSLNEQKFKPANRPRFVKHSRSSETRYRVKQDSRESAPKHHVIAE